MIKGFDQKCSQQVKKWSKKRPKYDPSTSNLLHFQVAVIKPEPKLKRNCKKSPELKKVQSKAAKKTKFGSTRIAFVGCRKFA